MDEAKLVLIIKTIKENIYFLKEEQIMHFHSSSDCVQ